MVSVWSSLLPLFSSFFPLLPLNSYRMLHQYQSKQVTSPHSIICQARYTTRRRGSTPKTYTVLGKIPSSQSSSIVGYGPCSRYSHAIRLSHCPSPFPPSTFAFRISNSNLTFRTWQLALRKGNVQVNRAEGVRLLRLPLSNLSGGADT